MSLRLSQDLWLRVALGLLRQSLRRTPPGRRIAASFLRFPQGPLRVLQKGAARVRLCGYSSRSESFVEKLSHFLRPRSEDSVVWPSPSRLPRTCAWAEAVRDLSVFVSSVAGLETLPPHSLDAALWEKVAVNAFINSVSVILDCPNGMLASTGPLADVR